MIRSASALALLSLAGGAPGPPPTIIFPGPQTSVRSPTSSARVFYVKMGADQGGQNLSLRFDSGRGRPVVLRRFDRSAEVGWSPSGRRFFVNDHIGSNLADCLIVRAGAGVRGVSLMRVIARSPGRPRETPRDSHYYVHCGGWRSDTIMAGVVGGHTDEARSHSFEHRFIYDALTGRLVWQR